MRRTEAPFDVLDQLRQLLVRGKFSSHVAVLASGTVLGQAAVFVVTPLLTRLYSPADLAIFGLLTSFLAVASIAVALRLELAIATTRDESEATRLLLACLVLTPIVGLLLSGMLAAMVSLDVLSYGLLPGWSVVLTFLALVLTGWFISLRYWHVGRHEFRPVGRALILQGVARAGSTVAFGFANFAWLGLMLGEIAGRAFGIRRLWVAAKAAVQQEITSYGIRRVPATISGASGFVCTVMPSSLINALAAAVPLPILLTLFGPEPAGQFALAWRVASVPGALVAASVGDVFHAHATWAHANPAGDVPGLLRNTLRKLAIASTFIYLPACLIAPSIFGWLFGSAWRPAGTLVLLLLPLWWASMVVAPVSRLPIVLGRPSLKLLFDSMFLILPVIALFLFSERGLDTAVFAFGLGAATALLVYAAVLLHMTSRSNAVGQA